MRIGLQIGNGLDPDGSLDGLLAFAKDTENLGFHSLWMASIFNYDPLTVLGMIAQHTQGIELGSAVAVTYSRQPMIMAQQALTVSAAAKGRFALGLGVSHQFIVQGMMGLSYEKPARHMREYLDILLPLMRGEPVAHQGEVFNVNAQLGIEQPQTPPVLLAALGPVMLKMAGSRTDGTSLWMVGPKTIASHIKPNLDAAAKEAGKPTPRIVCALPVALCSDADKARDTVNIALDLYKDLPAYRAMLDREDAALPADVGLIGDEATIEQQLLQLKEAGVTDLNAVLIEAEPGCYQRTRDLLVEFNNSNR